MIISVTETGVFRRCRRMWDYSSHGRQNMEPVSPAPHFSLGSCVHETLALWIEPEQAEAIERNYLDIASREIQRVETRYLTLVGAPISREEIDPLADDIALGLEMVKNYAEWWKEPLPKGFRFVQTEQTALVDIPNTEHLHCLDCDARFFEPRIVTPVLGVTARTACACGSLNSELDHVQLEGTFDGFIADEKDWLYILERKTYGNKPKLETLQMNDQFLAYVWMLSKLFPDNHIGGLLYDGLWKRGIETKRGPYRDLEDLFIRHKIIRPPEELAEFEQNIIKVARDMICPAIYPNRDWRGCWDCIFERLCTAESRGEDFEYVRDTYYGQRATDSRFDYQESE